MAIYIEKRGKRITVQSELPLSGMKTAVPGAYLTAAGMWTVPLSMESCKLLRIKFGKALKIGKELSAWARGVRDAREYMAALASAEDAELENLETAAPVLHKAMANRTYQRVGARFIADNPATLVADDPGLGKTLIAMAGILEADIEGPYLIVCPTTAADSVWRREIQRWLPKGHRPVTVGKFRYQREHRLTVTRFGTKTWLIINPEMLMIQAYYRCQECNKVHVQDGKQKTMLKCGHRRTRKTQQFTKASYPQLYDIEWGAIVVDESHESLIRRKGIPTQRRRGLDALRLRAGGLKLALSGTPFESKPEQLWGTLNWLDPVQYSAFSRWSELYWQKGGYTGHEIGEKRDDREIMLWESLSAIALRRTKAEVAQDLPPKMYVGSPLNPDDPDSPEGIWLEMEGKQAEAYRQMEALSIAQLESGQLDALSSLAEMTRLKQMACCYGTVEVRDVWQKNPETGERFFGPKQIFTPTLPSNKFDWIVENLEEWGYPGTPLTKVVIVSFYTGILNAMQRGLEKHFQPRRTSKGRTGKPLSCAITGSTPIDDRRAIIDRFNEHGTEQVMFLNVKAGGTAITLDCADRMIFVSETRIPDQQKQAEDRIHRISNPRHCMYYYLRSLGTIDVGTAMLNQEADRVSHRLLDGRRGVEYMRYVMAHSNG